VRVLIVTLDLHLPGVRSLKARRGVLEPLKARLRRDLNLSVSEVEPRHLHDRARLGLAAVVDNRATGDAQLSRIEAVLERDRRVTLIDREAEYW
jgi:uncharacterized protein YlxP (DUF503 family)